MAAKTEPKAPPKTGDVIGSGKLPDGRPYNDVFLDEDRTFRLTRIFVTESDDAYDKSLLPDGETINPRLNGRLQLASSIVAPEGITIDSFDKMTAFDLEVLFWGFNRLNSLALADRSGNA